MLFSELGKARAVLLTTFRQDGRPVGTAVWAAPDGDRLVVWTQVKSWKVKRIRRNPDVTLQACDMRGNTEGDVLRGRAEILDAAGTEHVRHVVSKKYGITGKLTIGASKLFKGADSTVGLSISPVE